MRRYLPKGNRRGVLGFNTPRPESQADLEEEFEEETPDSLQEDPPCPEEDDKNLAPSATATRWPWGPKRDPSDRPGCPDRGPGCPGGPNWPPWCPGNPPCPPGTGPGAPCPPRGIPLATAWVPWQVYNGYVHPCEMAGPGTIFPELLRCPPLYQKPPGT